MTISNLKMLKLPKIKLANLFQKSIMDPLVAAPLVARA